MNLLYIFINKYKIIIIILLLSSYFFLSSNALKNVKGKFGVIIGDSIAEGFPYSTGKLRRNSIFPHFYFGSDGQISDYLEKQIKYKVINHGISGQTSRQVRARWNRDVLALNDDKLSPSETLTRKPQFVIIVVGTNDILLNINADEIIDNLNRMINSSLSNNIHTIVLNIPPNFSINEKHLSSIKKVNNWLQNKKTDNSEIVLIDFYDIVNDSNNDGKPKPDMFIDKLHPTRETYKRLSEKIAKQAFN